MSLAHTASDVEFEQGCRSDVHIDISSVVVAVVEVVRVVVLETFEHSVLMEVAYGNEVPDSLRSPGHADVVLCLPGKLVE